METEKCKYVHKVLSSVFGTCVDLNGNVPILYVILVSCYCTGHFHIDDWKIRSILLLQVCKLIFTI